MNDPYTDEQINMDKWKKSPLVKAGTPSKIKPEKTRRVVVKTPHLGMKKCKYCWATTELTKDHKHPISLGGGNELKNLQCLCKRCNGMKSSIPHKALMNIFDWHIQIIIEKEANRKLQAKERLHEKANYN